MSPSLDDKPVVQGAVAGIGAWLLGYVLTYLLVATDIESSPLNRLIEAFGGESATYELVGWVFYNAHLVDITYTNLGLLSPAPNFVGGDGFTPFLYVVPPALLFVAGLAVGRSAGVSDPMDGAVAGVLVTPVYLVLAVVGAFVVTVSVGDASGGPDVVQALLIAGIVYPAVCSGLGGVVAAATES